MWAMWTSVVLFTASGLQLFYLCSGNQDCQAVTEPVEAGGSQMNLRCRDVLALGRSYQYPLCPLVPGVFLSLIFRYPMTEFCKP